MSQFIFGETLPCRCITTGVGAEVDRLNIVDVLYIVVQPNLFYSSLLSHRKLTTPLDGEWNGCTVILEALQLFPSVVFVVFEWDVNWVDDSFCTRLYVQRYQNVVTKAY